MLYVTFPIFSFPHHEQYIQFRIRLFHCVHSQLHVWCSLPSSDSSSWLSPNITFYIQYVQEWLHCSSSITYPFFSSIPLVSVSVCWIIVITHKLWFFHPEWFLTFMLVEMIPALSGCLLHTDSRLFVIFLKMEYKNKWPSSSRLSRSWKNFANSWTFGMCRFNRATLV